MRQLLRLRSPRGPGGSSTLQRLAIDTGRARGTLLLSLAGVLTYLLALAALLPARAALALSGAPPVWSDVAGRAWNGEIAVRDRLRIGWRGDAVRSIGRAALAADVQVSAAGTVLDGRARARPGWAVVEDLTGAAGWPLLAAFAPGLPFSCDIDMRVDVERLSLGADRIGVEGDVSSGAGPCTPVLAGLSSTGVALPALTATASRNDAVSTVTLAPRDDRAQPLLNATVTRGGRLSASVTPAGSALLPGGGVLPTTFEGQL